MVNLKWWEDPEQLRHMKDRLDAVKADRRDFLKIVGAFGGTAAVALAIEACGGSAGTTPAATTSTGGGTTSTSTTTTTTGGTATPSGGGAAAATPTTSGAASGVKLAADQTFKINNTYEPTSFDFNKDLYCNGDASCFAMLGQFDPDLKVIPDIATKWEPNADASVWTFTIRTDSKWSNGDPVTANDYEWSWKRQLDPATAASYAGFLYDLKNGEAFNTKKGGVTANDVGVKAKDAQTLVCTLEGPRAYFPVLATYIAAAPAHRPSVEKFGDKWTEAANIVCNGPFKLTQWNHNSDYTVEKNANYWNAKNITLTKVHVPIIADTAEFTAYQNGEIDMALHGALGNLQKVQTDATLKNEYHKFNLLGTWYLQPHVKMPPFDNKNVRLAMAHAIDRDTIVNQVLRGLGTPAYNLTPPGMPGFNPSKYEAFTSYDPKKAMSLLDGTPYAGGKNWPKITMTQRNNEGDAPRAAGDAIIQMLQQNLGMQIEHVLGDPKQVYNEAYQQRLQLLWWRWYIDYPDPNDEEYLVFYSKFPSGERNSYSNPQFDDLVTKAAGESDQTKRFQMYWQADQILIEDGADIFVYNPWNYMLAKPYVAGIPKDKDGNFVPDWNVFLRMYDRIQIAQH